jgi:hypothetical protein
LLLVQAALVAAHAPPACKLPPPAAVCCGLGEQISVPRCALHQSHSWGHSCRQGRVIGQGVKTQQGSGGACFAGAETTGAIAG